jgi:hypothetical protein
MERHAVDQGARPREIALVQLTAHADRPASRASQPESKVAPGCGYHVRIWYCTSRAQCACS